jgi:protein-disulfide isomerase
MIKPHILAAAALLAIPAAAGQAQSQDLANPDTAFAAPPEQGNWQGVIAKTERGHLIGNPEAETQLIEFVSYTCGHCANFTQQGEPALDLALLMPGKMGLEVRPVIRNALDLTVSLLAQCGDPAGFKARHRAFMFSQEPWLGKVRAAPQSQQAIWARGDKASRMNAATALGLADMLISRGQSASEVNACLTDDTAAMQLMENGRADYAEFGVNSTPSFALDRKLLNEVHGWESLYPVLSAHFAPAPERGLGEPG